MLIDLECHGFRRKLLPFKVELHHFSLDHLIADAMQAYRVYELFLITRPGDIWKYIWVQNVDVDEVIQNKISRARENAAIRFAKYHPWPENFTPYVIFDRLFKSYGDDTEPEDICWLMHHKSESMKEYADSLFNRITDIQNQLRASEDELIQQEIQFLLMRQHHCDHDPEPPFLRSKSDYQSIVSARYSNEYYTQLKKLVADANVEYIALSSDQDYATIKILCQEQRIRTTASGLRPLKSLMLNMLSDGCEYTHAWGAEIIFYSEGMAGGDLWIEQERRGACIKELVEVHNRSYPTFFSTKYEGNIEGYTQEDGDGWVLYRAQKGTKTIRLSDGGAAMLKIILGELSKHKA